VYPYHVSVPSFGEWGFVMAADRRLQPSTLAPEVPTRFLNAATVPHLFAFPSDIAAPDTVRPSTLDRPRVLDLYLAGWRYWN
jgi:spermidine synthase